MSFSNLMSDRMCRPFSFNLESTGIGSRIGGKPPLDAIPTFDSICQKYFGTIELELNWCVSIFYSLDRHGNDESRDIISFNNRPLYSSELIQAVIHRSERMHDHSNILSEVTCHEINIESEQPDVADSDFVVPYSRSKIGGRPYVDNAAVVGGVFEQLLKDGFQQLLQFDTPNPRTHSHVVGFPWDPGWLHVFLRGTNVNDYEFAFVIQQ